MDGLSGLEVKVICDKKVKFFSSLGGRGKGEPEEKADKKKNSLPISLPLGSAFSYLSRTTGGTANGIYQPLNIY